MTSPTDMTTSPFTANLTAPPTQNTFFSGANHHWGTIAVEINHN